MGKWMDLAAQLEATAIGRDDSDDSDDSCFTVTNVTIVTAGVPAAIIAGLAELQSKATPRITRPEVWPGIVMDAVRVVEEGWAEKALALNWTAEQVWGCSPEPGGNVDHDGLAVWLAGRRVLLLDEWSCIVEEGPNARAVFTRPQIAVPGSVLLWELEKASAL